MTAPRPELPSSTPYKQRDPTSRLEPPQYSPDDNPDPTLTPAGSPIKPAGFLADDSVLAVPAPTIDDSSAAAAGRSDGSQTEDSLLDGPVSEEDETEPALTLPELPELETAAEEDRDTLLPLVMAYAALSRPAGVAPPPLLPALTADGGEERMRRMTVPLAEAGDWPERRSDWTRALLYLMARLDHIVSAPAASDERLLAELAELAAMDDALRPLPARLQQPAASVGGQRETSTGSDIPPVIGGEGGPGPGRCSAPQSGPTRR